MFRRRDARVSMVVAALALTVELCFPSVPVRAQARPRLLILDGEYLRAAKDQVRIADSILSAPFKRLMSDADTALSAGPFTVTHKNLLPPSHDKHDYMSLAPYWWPNPHTSTGLPYVRRDGQVNPERDQTSDRKRLDNLIRSVNTLALAYFFTEKETYAERASTLIRVWFLDAATRMNPQLKYAQAVPGRNIGRGAGIIETHDLPGLLDSVVLLNGSKSWASSDQKRLQSWFDAYLAWLLESPEGKAEAKAENNHGTWYDVQVAAFAVFAAREDGRQPRELARTQAWHYALFNLDAMFTAASIADKLGLDLWHDKTQSQPNIHKALDWLLPFAVGETKWPYPQIADFQPENLAPLLRRAAIQYRQPAYDKALDRLPKITRNERWRLLYPKTLPGKTVE